MGHDTAAKGNDHSVQVFHIVQSIGGAAKKNQCPRHSIAVTTKKNSMLTTANAMMSPPGTFKLPVPPLLPTALRAGSADTGRSAWLQAGALSPTPIVAGSEEDGATRGPGGAVCGAPLRGGWP